MIVLACVGSASAQVRYKVADQGLLHNSDNFSMVMGLNNLGWTENMDGFVNPPVTSTSTTVASGRAVINVHGFNIDLGTLGGKNSWTNYGGINDHGEAVGMAETAVLDPDGEDMCGFRTQKTCRPFLWRDGHIMALPTLGGNNGQASAINNRGLIVGISETTDSDPGCSASKPGKIVSPVSWEKGEAHALPVLVGDTDGFVQGLNDRGQAVGSTGNCNNIQLHAVLWENGTAFQLPDLGHAGNDAYAINHHGQAVGFVADGSTILASVWPNGANGGVTTIPTLAGDGAAFATGINDRGQVVGSTFNSQGWSRGFISQHGVVTDLNSLISEDSNLRIIAASNINDRGQISGMAMVKSGPDKGKIHAILLTPVNERIGRSIISGDADTRPKSDVPANVRQQVLPRFLLDRFDR